MSKIPPGMTDVSDSTLDPFFVKTSDVKVSDKFADAIKKIVLAAVPFVEDTRSMIWRFYLAPGQTPQGKTNCWLFHYQIDFPGGKWSDLFYAQRKDVRSMSQKAITDCACGVIRTIVAAAINNQTSKIRSRVVDIESQLAGLDIIREQLRKMAGNP